MVTRLYVSKFFPVEFGDVRLIEIGFDTQLMMPKSLPFIIEKTRLRVRTQAVHAWRNGVLAPPHYFGLILIFIVLISRNLLRYLGTESHLLQAD